MLQPKIYSVKSNQMNKFMQDFTLSARMWTAYSADKVETVARHYGLIPHNAYYREFDAENEQLLFGVNPLDIPEGEIVTMDFGDGVVAFIGSGPEHVIKGVPDMKKLPPSKG